MSKLSPGDVDSFYRIPVHIETNLHYPHECCSRPMFPNPQGTVFCLQQLRLCAFFQILLLGCLPVRLVGPRKDFGFRDAKHGQSRHYHPSSQKILFCFLHLLRFLNYLNPKSMSNMTLLGFSGHRLTYFSDLRKTLDPKSFNLKHKPGAKLAGMAA